VVRNSTSKTDERQPPRGRGAASAESGRTPRVWTRAATLAALVVFALPMTLPCLCVFSAQARTLEKMSAPEVVAQPRGTCHNPASATARPERPAERHAARQKAASPAAAPERILASGAERPCHGSPVPPCHRQATSEPAAPAAELKAAALGCCCDHEAQAPATATLPAVDSGLAAPPAVSATRFDPESVASVAAGLGDDPLDRSHAPPAFNRPLRT
jgi:hypothetical protein